MKKGLIKKSIFCVLSLSVACTLAACTNSRSGEKSISSTNVFADKDIMAYAKRHNMKTDKINVELKEIDLMAYTVARRNEYYALLKNNSTNVYYLYIVLSNKTVELGEDVTGVETREIFGHTYGYYIISFYGGQKALVDYNGTVIENQNGLTDVQFKTYSNIDEYTEGKVTFYEALTLQYGYSTTSTKYYKVEANMKAYYFVTDFERTEATASDIDYSNIDTKDGYYAVKSYNLTINSSSVIVKDLKDKVVSTFALYQNNTYFVLDDKLFYQTTQTVTMNDDYTYADGTSYYLLKSYSVDLKTGVSTLLKDFDYKLVTYTNVFAYNEKNDREYVGAIYATLNKIENKRLSTMSVKAMVDKNCKILSDKVGEKGSVLSYLNDNTYILSDGVVSAILNKKGKAKAVLYNKSFYVDYDNELFFMPSGSGSITNPSGFYLDSDLKIYEYAGVSTYTCYARYNNGNAIFSTEDGIGLVKVENKKVVEIARYDSDNFSTSLVPYKTAVTGFKYVMVNDILTPYNIYIVETKTETGWDLDIVSQDGEVLKTLTDVTELTFYNDSCLLVNIITSTGSYSFGVVETYSSLD